MRLLEQLLYALLLASSTAAASAADDEPKTKPLDPCTIKSPTSGSFFDLRKIHLKPPTDDDTTKKRAKDVSTKSWHSRGWDYGANFTLNFCGPVIEHVTDVVGVDKKHWGSVGAFYDKAGETYSLGMNNSYPVFRGRKLVLNFTDGSPCPSSGHNRKRARLPHTTESTLDAEIGTTALKGGDDDDDDERQKPDTKRRKNTIISLLCERDPTAPVAAVSFVGTPDECSYFFEARTSAACPTINTQKETLGPGGVFGVIALVAILVYIIGGVFYQRIVMHQRGWRQLPNYAIWASIGSFIRDFVVIIGASFARCLPGRGRRGFGLGAGPSYSRVNGNVNGSLGRNARRGGSDDENRLIDQLDEEWDD